MEDFFLIGGVPSSGSTLLSTMLDCHPDIYCGPETNVFSHPALWNGTSEIKHLLSLDNSPMDPSSGVTWVRPSSAGIEYSLTSLTELRSLAVTTNDLSALIEFFFLTRKKIEKKAIACEKSPPNAYAIPSALMRFPNMKAIFTIRAIEPVIESLNRRKSKDYLSVIRWLTKTTVALNALERFGPERIHILRYEDLVTSPEVTLKSLLAFMGVEHETSISLMINRHGSKRVLSDNTIDGSFGASAAWNFLPTGPLSKNIRTVKLASPTLKLLNSIRLNPDLVSCYSLIEKTYSVAEAMERLGYHVGWDQDVYMNAPLDFPITKNRLFEFNRHWLSSEFNGAPKFYFLKRLFGRWSN